MFEASSVPLLVAPAPTIVCISSMNKMGFFSSITSFITFFNLFSKSPLYFVPATRDPISSEKILVFFNLSGISLLAIFNASPSTMAVLPTPGSPTRIGLFFFLLHNI